MRYGRLGRRTFLALLFRSSWLPLLALAALGCLAALLLAISRADSQVVAILLWTGGFLALAAVGGAVAAAWLQYAGYAVVLDGNGISVRRGSIAPEEFTIPYRAIKEVTDSLGLSDILFGTSMVTVVFEQGESIGNSSLRLKALPKGLAAGLRERLERLH